MKLAACTILYNPELEIMDNIYTYVDYVDVLYCIDNSTTPNKKLIDALKKDQRIRYVSMSKNVGLALALSHACDLAIQEGYDYILTMDQDTEFEKGSLMKLISFIQSNGQNYSIVAPNIKLVICNGDKKTKSVESLYPVFNQEPMWVITSGGIVNLSDYIKVGGFDEKLFIGQIDQDYCCNLYSHNKKIIRIGNAFIYQEAGNTNIRTFLWKKIKVPQYNAMRYYYIFRNEVYLRAKWKKLYSNFKTSLLKYLIIILFYEKDKIIKLRTCIKALIDGKSFGKNI